MCQIKEWTPRPKQSQLMVKLIAMVLFDRQEDAGSFLQVRNIPAEIPATRLLSGHHSDGLE